MFYLFNQNNSGGSFVCNDKLTCYTIIEAETPESANEKAESLGIYFDGCNSGSDCECCGDRWCPVDKRDGTETPLIYGKPPHQYYSIKWKSPICYIHYANGITEEVK